MQYYVSNDMAKKPEMSEAAIEKHILANLHRIVQSGRTGFSKEELLQVLHSVSAHQVENVLKILSGSVIDRPNHAGNTKVKPLYRLRSQWTAEAIQSLRDRPPIPLESVPRREGRSLLHWWDILGVPRIRKRR